LVGRWCGVKVDAFSIGFGPELFGFCDRHGTRWRVALLPLGGYVKFHGDANAASVSDPTAVLTMPAEELKVSFFAQPVWKRAAIVAAGPIANFILAVVIFSGIFLTYGKLVLTPRVDSVRAGEAAEAAGFQPGDLILSIEGKPIESWTEMQRVVQVSADLPLNFVVRRGEKDVALVAIPKLRMVDTPFGKNRVGLIGLNASPKPEDWKTQHFNPISAVNQAVAETWYVGSRTVTFVSGLFVGRESLEQVSGPIGTGYIAGKVAEIGFSALLNLAAVLSISIGLINLFPVPLLDGGHLLFYAIEALKGRPLNEKYQEYGFRMGLVLVAALMLFATFNDILNLTRG